MLVRRCAWHRHYQGYPLLYGIASWRGAGIAFTDGVCRRCAAFLKGHMGVGPARPARRRSPAPRVAVAAVVLGIALFSARAVDRARPPLASAPPVLSGAGAMIARPGPPAPARRAVVPRRSLPTTTARSGAGEPSSTAAVPAFGQARLATASPARHGRSGPSGPQEPRPRRARLLLADAFAPGRPALGLGTFDPLSGWIAYVPVGGGAARAHRDLIALAPTGDRGVGLQAP